MRMPLAGLEPARIAPLDFESSASATSATAAFPFIIIAQYQVACKDFFRIKVLFGNIFNSKKFMKSDEASLKLTEKSGRVYYKAVPPDIALWI